MIPRVGIKGLLAGLGAMGCATAHTSGTANTTPAGEDTVHTASPLPSKCSSDFGRGEAWKAVARGVLAVEMPEGRYAEDVHPLLSAALNQLNVLAASGAISSAEKDLFSQAVQSNYAKIPNKPLPPDAVPPTCYAPSLSPENEAAMSLRWRLPLLETVAAAGSLNPALLCRVLKGMETDLDRVRSVLHKLDARLSSASSDSDKEAMQLKELLGHSEELYRQLGERLQKLNVSASGVR